MVRAQPIGGAKEVMEVQEMVVHTVNLKFSHNWIIIMSCLFLVQVQTA